MKKVLFILLIAVNICLGQNENSFLNKVQTKFKQIENFKAEFVQKTKYLTVDNNVKISGGFIYKQGGKYIIELKGQTIVSNGETIWNFNKKLNRVVVNNVSDDPSSFSIEKFIYDYPKFCDVKSIETNSLHLKPQNDDLDFQDATIWFTKDLLIQKLEIRDNTDALYELTFNKIEINQDIKDSQFTFEPEESTKIIDLR